MINPSKNYKVTILPICLPFLFVVIWFVPHYKVDTWASWSVPYRASSCPYNAITKGGIHFPPRMSDSEGSSSEDNLSPEEQRQYKISRVVLNVKGLEAVSNRLDKIAFAMTAQILCIGLLMMAMGLKQFYSE